MCFIGSSDFNIKTIRTFGLKAYTCTSTRRSIYIIKNPFASVGAFMHHMKWSPDFQWCIYTPHAHATPFLTSLRLPALSRPRLCVNGLGMSKATILESGVVIRFESFELQPFKVDQLFRGVFKRSSNCNTYRNEAFKDIFSCRGNSL